MFLEGKLMNNKINFSIIEEIKYTQKLNEFEINDKDFMSLDANAIKSKRKLN